jgi:post-segregation antitoxin (ccd killing protein)
VATIPFRKTKRETQRQIAVWVEADEVDYLLKKNVNVSELVRAAIREAYEKVKK